MKDTRKTSGRGPEFAGVYGRGKRSVVVATGSPGELGLLEVLAGAFSRETHARVCWRKAGTGESLKLLRAGLADAVMVHAAAAERRAVREGWAVGRRRIGANEFFLVGPRSDPARAASAGGIVEAYRRIAAGAWAFLSRADRSGTHVKERAIWRKAGLSPAGAWYRPTGDFMTASLRQAQAHKCYFMTDSSTWIVERAGLPGLCVLVRDDPLLLNVYHAMSRPGSAGGAAFAEFLVGAQAQEIFRGYGRRRYGEALYRGVEGGA